MSHGTRVMTLGSLPPVIAHNTEDLMLNAGKPMLGSLYAGTSPGYTIRRDLYPYGLALPDMPQNRPLPTWKGRLGGACLGCNPTLGATGSPTISPVFRTIWMTASIAGVGLGAYHGYRRNDSVGWAIGWALLGSIFPVITLPVMFAQGFGKPKRRK